MKDTEWNAEHKGYQNGYVAGFLRAYKLVHSALDLRKELDHELIRAEFENEEEDDGKI